MRRSVFTYALLSLAALGGCAHAGGAAVAAATSAAPATLVVVVRHGEKAPDPGNDPVLSAAGMARAVALDSAVRGMPITDVVVSQLQRTRLSASSFIARSGAVVHVVPISAAGVPAHIQAVADTVRSITRVAGHGVLVVGHSNTVTAIVEALGGPASRPLCDSQYSQFFALRGAADGRITLARSTYGATDPVDPACAATMSRP